MASGSFGDSLVYHQDRDVIPNRINSTTLPTLQALRLILEKQRFLADGADQDVEQVLGNHDRDSTPFVLCTKGVEDQKLSPVSWQPSAVSSQLFDFTDS